MDELYTEEIAAYCNDFTEPELPILIELKEDTYKSAHGSVMLSEKRTAKFLQFCIQMSYSKVVLDIGTYIQPWRWQKWWVNLGWCIR